MSAKRWCKQFQFASFIIILLSSLSSTSASAGDEPSEEPEESYIVTETPKTTVLTEWSSTTINNIPSPSLSTTTETPFDVNEASTEKYPVQPESRSFIKHGISWKIASKVITKGLRVFRDSLLEGAKVAHMFKEDVGEGVSSIMRQNRGVKSNQRPQQNDGFNSFFDAQVLREGVIGGILRFMGVNSKQMGVIALNVLIILAEWITSSMVGGNEVIGATSRMIKTNLLEWASTGYNPQIDKFLSQAKSHSLPEKLITKLSEKTGNNTSCVQLLICKMTPVIQGFQDTVKDQLSGYGAVGEDLFKNKSDSAETEPRGFLSVTEFLLDKFLGRLPPKDIMVDFGDKCEAKFPQCQLLKFD